MAAALRMTEDECSAFARDGFLLRRDVFSAAEVVALRDASEQVIDAVTRRAQRTDGGPEIRLPDGHRLQFSSRTAIQWEWREGSQEVRLIEPFDHLDERLAALMADPRFLEPMKDAIGCEHVAPFTSKLNLKRAREGSRFPYHQDYPYWYMRIEEQAADVATAMLFLDDADAANGALRVLPGSHQWGPVPRDRGDPTRALADPAQLDTSREVVVEAPAGSVVFFGSLLVHRSSANESARDRRALLPSFQPAGRVRWHDAPYRPERIERLP